MVNSTLVDEDTFYGEVSEVEAWIRNKEFSTSTDLTTDNVESKLKRASEKIDKLTGRAWRERRLTLNKRVTVSKRQRDWYEKGRKHRSSHGRGRRGLLNPIDPWALVTLPSKYVRELDPGEDDELVVLKPLAEEDITDEEGRDASWHLEIREGRLYVHVKEFSVGPLRGGGGMVPKPKVRVSYRYGEDEIPADINEAAERWVAADLINTDSYGSVLGSGPDNTPDMTTGASELFAGTREILNQYAGRPVL